VPPIRRILLAAAVALCAGLTAIVVMDGFSPSGPLRVVETLAVVGFVAAVVFGGAIAIGLRLADYREPASEEDFELVVRRAERLAREGTAAEPEETEFLDLDPYVDMPDRIVVYRDTLRRDFGHDPELLREQVTITVRHELAHHIGFDELGVRDLGL